MLSVTVTVLGQGVLRALDCLLLLPCSAPLVNVDIQTVRLEGSGSESPEVGNGIHFSLIR